MTNIPFETRQFPAEQLKFLQLKIFRGDIELIGTDTDVVEISTFGSVRTWDNLFISKPLEKQNGNHTLFQLEVNQDSWNIRPYSMPAFWETLSLFSISFRIRLPKHVSTHLTTTLGRISIVDSRGTHRFSASFGGLVIDGHKGRLDGRTSGGNITMINSESHGEISTKGGNISVRDSRGDISLKTAGGNVDIHHFSGKIYTSTFGGNIRASEVSGDFKTSTSGGNITLSAMKGNIGASTSGGRVRAEVLAVHEYLWLETSGGNIRAELPLDQGLHLDLKAERVRVPKFQQFRGEFSKSRVLGSLNGGGANVSIKTSGGRIQITPSFRHAGTARSEPRKDTTPKAPASVVKEPQHTKPPSFSENKEPQNIIYPSRGDGEKWWKGPFWSVVYALVFISLFVYGLNSLIYFSMLLAEPPFETSGETNAVFLSNITTGFAVFLSGVLFTRFMDSKITHAPAKYTVLIVMSYTFVILIQMMQRGIYFLLDDHMPFWEHYWQMSYLTSPDITRRSESSLIYVTVPAIVSAVYLYTWRRSRKIDRKISEQEYQLLHLEKLKTRAQLSALEAKINPHFLYNSLNSIASLIHENPDKAEDMTIQLSKLFRYTTGRTAQNFHTIGEELEIVKTYLAIEQTRFGDRLSFEIRMDNDMRDILIPRFLLQPLVENAIKHGISKMTDKGLVEIQVTHKGDSVEFIIHDNGPEFEEGPGGGYGLRSIRDKLNLIYGNEATFEILNNERKAVFLKLPLHIPQE